MPIDPNVLNAIANPQQFKLDDPLEKFNNYLLADTRMSGLRKEKRDRERLNALDGAFKTEGALNPDGSYNFGVISNALAASGVGSAIPEQYKQTLEHSELIGKRKKLDAETTHEGFKALGTQANTAKTNAEAVEQAMKNFTKDLETVSTDPTVGVPQLIDWTRRQFKDPVLGPALTAQGMTEEKALARLQETLKSMPYDQFLLTNRIGSKDASKQNYTTIDYGDHKQFVATNEHSLSTPTQHVVSDGKMGIDPGAVAKARASAPVLNVTNTTYVAGKGNQAYSEEWNKNLAKADRDLMDAANAAPDLIGRANELDAMLKGGKIITGAFAGPRLQAEKIGQLFGMGDAETIANTEQAVGTLAKNTLSALASVPLGVISDGDRAFVAQAAGGNIDNSAAGIRRYNDIARRTAQAQIRRWQTRKAEIQGTGIQGAAYPQTTPTAPPAPGGKLSPAARKYLQKHGH